MTDLLTDLVRRHGGLSPRVTMSISGKHMAFRSFLMPTMKHRDLESAIAFESRKQVPFPIDDCHYAYRQTSGIVNRGKAQVRIALHAATRTFLDAQLEPFRRAGIEVAHVHHAQDVIGRLLRFLPGFNQDASYTVVGISRGNSEIAFYRGDSLQFFHLGSAGDSLLGEHPDMTRMEHFAESLANEIQISHDYYAGQSTRDSSRCIYLYGDIASSGEIIEMLNGRTGSEFKPFPVEQLNFLTTQEKVPGPDLIPCLPAVAAAVSPGRQINLLPADDLQRINRKVAHRRGRGLTALLMAILIAGYGMMSYGNSTLRGESTSLDNQVASIQRSPAYAQYMVLQRRIAADRSYISNTRQNSSYLHLDLKDLAAMTPEDVKLLRVDFDPAAKEGEFQIYGQVTSSDVPPEMILAEFVENLRASVLFDGVAIVKHVKSSVKETFRIDFEIRMRGLA